MTRDVKLPERIAVGASDDAQFVEVPLHPPEVPNLRTELVESQKIPDIVPAPNWESVLLLSMNENAIDSLKVIAVVIVS